MNTADAGDLGNKSVVKAMVVLTELGWHPAGATATELAQAVGISRPTVFRLLLSLVQSGFVERVDDRYRLGWKVARLGRQADPHGGIVARVQPRLEALAVELNEMIGYAVANGDADFELIAEAAAPRLLSVSQGYIGQDLPLHATAMGKLALADLPDERVRALVPEALPKLANATITQRSALLATLCNVRRLDYAIVDDELEDGLFAAAVPVRTQPDRLIGLIAVTGPSQRVKARPLDGIIGRLRAVADTIAKDLSGAS